MCYFNGTFYTANTVLYMDLVHCCNKFRKLTPLPRSKHLKLHNNVILARHNLFSTILMVVYIPLASVTREKTVTSVTFYV
jgi:hypothetical protein